MRRTMVSVTNRRIYGLPRQADGRRELNGSDSPEWRVVINIMTVSTILVLLTLGGLMAAARWEVVQAAYSCVGWVL